MRKIAHKFMMISSESSFFFGNEARINVEKCCVNHENFVAFQF